MGWLIVVLVVAGLGAAMVAARRWSRRRRLTAIVAECVGVRNDWIVSAERGTATLSEARGLAEQLVGRGNEQLEGLIDELAGLHDTVGDEINALPWSVDGSSPAEAEAAWSQAVRQITRFERTQDKTRSAVDGLRTKLDELGPRRAASGDAIVTARTTVAGIAERGWLVDDLEADLTDLEAELGAVTVEPPLDVDAVAERLGSLEATAKRLDTEAAQRPEQHRSLLETAGELATRLEALRDDRTWLENQLEAWALLHHPTSLISVSEHPPAVAGRADEADSVLVSVAGDGGMLDLDRQDLRGAAAGIEQATTLVDQGEAMIDEAKRLNVELATAAVEAETRVTDAGAASERLHRYVVEHPHDLRATFAGPAAAKLTLDPPDNLGAMREADGTIAGCAAELAAAEAEVKRMNRLRSQADDALRRARRAVAELDDYTDGLLAGLFGSGRRTEVEGLQRRLAEAARLNRKTTNRPQDARRQADAIGGEARKLLAEYKRQDEAERRRRMADD